MKEKFAKLINVKSLVTLALTAVFAFLAATGRVSAEQFLTVFTVIIAFYFGTQAQKSADGERIATPSGATVRNDGGTEGRGASGTPPPTEGSARIEEEA